MGKNTTTENCNMGNMHNLTLFTMRKTNKTNLFTMGQTYTTKH